MLIITIIVLPFVWVIVPLQERGNEWQEDVFYFLEGLPGLETITVLRDVAFDPDNGSNGTVKSYELISVVNQDGDNLTNRFINVPC